MSFIWPWILLGLVVAPVLVAAYLWLMARRRRNSAEFRSMGLAGSASDDRAGRRRHIPYALFLTAIVLLLVALARPQMVVALPQLEGTVILAFDVSNSMTADDLEPTRIEAAKEAASRFVEAQPSTIEIGVVAFSDGGLIVQAPTNLEADVLAAIGRLSTQGGTSIGEGIHASLNAIAGEPIDLGDALDEDTGSVDVGSVDIGYMGSAAIVMLSDGENTTRSSPTDMAQLAANAGVRIFPIGIGSPKGAVVEIDGFSVATSLNQELLEEIATITDGVYHQAEDAAALTSIYSTIDLELSVEGEELEVTGLLSGLGLMLLLGGGVLTMLWFGRLP